MNKLALDVIRLDCGTQPRAETDATVVEEYRLAYLEQAKDPTLKRFPPVRVYFDGQTYMLAGGFHRYLARQLAGFPDIEADVIQGTQRDAVWFSLGDNADNGLRLTNEDKRRAVRRLLEDPEWRLIPDTRIARHIQVTQPFVSSIRAELFPDASHNGSTLRNAQRGGMSYQIDVANNAAGRRFSPSKPQDTGQASAGDVGKGSGGSGGNPVPAAPGHREKNERPRYIAVDEALRSIAGSFLTLPDPRTAASEVGDFDIDLAFRIATWFSKFAGHKRGQIERAS